MVVKKLVPFALAASLLAGCTTGGTKETVGTVGGAVAGGLIGSQIGGGTGKLVATGVGTLLGAFVGREIGSSLDRADSEYAAGAARRAYAAPVGERIAWNNPQSGNSGTVTTIRDGYSNAGTYCREYQQTVVVGGKTEMAYGTACKQPDGTWKIVANQ
ncbi:RT0821/Lpp0805 family surface protein [Azospirillum agricola]|uniref:RT0821/Lpp0805 family surface protein n=1 Tax=Azospirillum agricola TaxID=1720247 RepID=UPI000A0EF430|nr:RT0821/Lpp0805 family surface protein [Azospirillum agricola]SMH58989.1 Surface antigen [Azospirillum lipoferum]